MIEPGHNQSQFSLGATPQIYAWVYLAEVHTSSTLIINWRTPDGAIYQQSSEMLVNTGGSLDHGVSFQDVLPLVGSDDVTMGRWTVEALLDDGTGVSASFTLIN
jgi:hypothetical protein